MPLFQYQCLDPRGKRRSGRREAPDADRCRQVLREEGLYPVRVEPLTPSQALAPKRGFPSGRSPSTERERALALRQLAALVSSHVPVVEAVDAVGPQIKNQALRQAFTGISESLHRGVALSDALRRERIFPEKLPELVAVSEATGTLGMVLSEFVRTEEAVLGLRRRVVTSLVYPAFLAIVSILVLVFLFIIVLPRVTEVFAESGVVLPSFTLFVISAGSFLRQYGLYILLFISAAVIFFRRAWRHPGQRLFWWGLLRRIPAVREFSNRYSLAAFARNLGVLNRGGVKLLEALQLVRNIVPDPVFQREIALVGAELGKGSSLAGALEKRGIFPSMLVRMVRVGEQTGELSPMLERAAGFYQEELETELTRLVALLEPTMIVLMGLVVGAIVISVLLPIFEMSRIIG